MVESGQCDPTTGRQRTEPRMPGSWAGQGWGACLSSEITSVPPRNHKLLKAGQPQAGYILSWQRHVRQFFSLSISPQQSLACLIPSWHLLLSGPELIHHHVSQKMATPTKRPVECHRCLELALCIWKGSKKCLINFQTLQFTVQIIHSINAYQAPLLMANTCIAYT